MKLSSVLFVFNIWLLIACSRSPYASFGGGPKRLSASPKKLYAQNQSISPDQVAVPTHKTPVDPAPVPFLSPEAGTTKNLRNALRKLDRNEASASTSSLTTMEKIRVAREVVRVKKEIEKSELVQDATAPKANGSNQLVAAILCFLLGYLGIHRFYLGYIWQGLVQLFTFGGCGIWALIDLIRILIGDLKPKGGRYVETLDSLDF